MSSLVGLVKSCYHGLNNTIRRSRGEDMRFYADGFPIDAWMDKSYDEWFRAHKAGEAELKRQRDAWVDFSIQPTFSFIVPLYKTPSEYLHTMVDSVLAQTYPNLQLVLVNASPELEALSAEVAAYCTQDARITFVDLEDNLGITENTNAGLEVATGEFCCFLDHDDAIEPSLLFEYVSAINENPEIDVLYCDEDLVCRDEKRGGFKHLHPLHKPAYAPELLLCKNYIVHLMTIRRTLIDSMPKPDRRYDGAQDYNMVAYCVGRARAVHGVQKVLYHWRISDTSTAANPDAKPYSRKAYRLSAFNEIGRRVPGGRIIASGAVNIHNVWLSDPQASASVVMLASDSSFEVERTLECFKQTPADSFAELIVVGEWSDWLASLCKRFGAKLLDVSADASCLARYNVGAAAASGDGLVFFDSLCTFLTPEPLRQLAGWCSMDGIGIAAPKILYRNGTNKSYGVAVTSERIMPMYRGYDDDFPGYQCNLRAMQNVSAVGLQGMCVRRDVFGRIGGFDASFGAEVGAVDLCRRVLNEGLRIVATPTVKIEVDEAAPERRFDCASNAPDYPAADIARFDEKWPGVRAAGDPYLNPNLDQSSSYQQLPARR